MQRAGYAAVAKSYILYRKNREKLREMRSTVLDYKSWWTAICAYRTGG